MGPSKNWAFAALLAALVLEGTLATDVCRTGCKGSDSQTFKYSVGTTYKYNYHGKIDITLSSAEGQSTSTEIKATALLTQLPDCNQLLKLQNVQVIESGNKVSASIPDVERPIRINVHDGHIEDSICVEDGDTQNSINLKRAIVSAFQANLKSAHETDVFGLCPTQFAQNLEGNTLHIQKRRNLNKCAYRENIRQDFLTTTFNADSEIKSSPILDAHYNSKLKIVDGILDSTSIVEDYLYVPFSVGQNGARAQVTTKLNLAGTSKDTPQTTTSKPKSIIFENPHPVVVSSVTARELIAALKAVVSTVDVVVGETTAKEFVKLLKLVRSSSKDALLGAFNQVQSGGGLPKDVAKRILLDAILRSGNGEAVETAVALLKNNQLEEIDQHLVYLGLNLVRHATEGSLVAAAELLGQKKLPREAYLGIGNLAGVYCRQHDCSNVDVVHKLTEKLLSKLGNASTKKREDENDAIYVLKALANFRVLDDSVVAKLTPIAQDKKASNRLRVAALQAFLADPCKDKLRDSALTVLQDQQQDSEIRIKAYLAVSRCPNAKIGNAVKSLLETETSVQVGGFIESHIRALKASANPDKELAKQHLGFRLANKFPIDPRKYSYSGEISYNVNTLGLSESTEADVIFSQDSWLPRSTNLNLTAQVFGHTFNFLEVQTRQENLDRLVEHYLGPRGVLRSGSLNDLWKAGQKSGSGLLKTLQTKVGNELKRHKRDLSKADLDYISKQVQINTNSLNKDLDLDLSVKAFGGEVLFLNINQEIQSLAPEAVIDKLVKEFGKGLDKIKNFEKTLRSNIVFLDGEFDYPTSLGFPLRIGLEGTASVQLKTKGNIDVRGLSQNLRDGNLKLSLIPSANIEVTGRLTLDALVVESGLKVVSTLYSSVGGDLDVVWRDGGNDLEVKYGLPVKEQKLVSVNHEIVFHKREQNGRETNLPLKFAQSKDFSICLDQLSPIIGLTFCAEINGPNLAGKQVPVLPYPFAGDAKLAVTIENDDVSLYRLTNKFNTPNNPGAWDLVVEAVGKNKQSKASLTVTAQSNPDRLIRAVLAAPSKSISLIAEGKITNNNQEKSVSALFGQNGQEFFGKVGLSVSGSSDKTVYKPLLEYRTPQGPQNLPVQFEGQIVHEKNGKDFKFIFDGVKLKLDSKTAALSGEAGLQNDGFFADLTATDGVQQASLKGRLQGQPSELKFNAEFQNTINPHVNFNVKGDLKNNKEEQSGSLQIIHGKDLSSKVNIITASSSLTRRFKSSEDFLFATKNKLTYPLFGIDTKLEFEHAPKKLEYDVALQYNDVKIGSELEAKLDKKEQGDYDLGLEFELWGLDNKVKLELNRVTRGEESQVEHKLDVNGKILAVKGKVRHLFKQENVHIGADLTINIPTQNEPVKVNWALKHNQNELDYYEKITSGSDVLFDAFIKATKGGNVNSNIKVNLKNVLVVNGQIKANKGNGVGDILVDLQGLKRQVKAETKFNVKPTELYDVQLTVYPVYDQDKTKKVVLSTITKLTLTSVDSKNVVDVLGHKLEVNAVGSNVQDKNDHNLNGQLEITLPDEQYLLAKGSCQQKETNKLLNGQSQSLLEYRTNKNSPGKKISWKSVWKNTNYADEKLDVVYNLAADDSNGRTLNADLTYKQDKTGEDYSVNLASKLYGSLLNSPFETTLVARGSDEKAQYDFRTANGPNAVLSIKGNYDLTEGKPSTGVVTLDLQTPSKALKILQVALSGSALAPVKDGDNLLLQGSAQVIADDDGTNPGPILEVKTEGNLRINKDNGEIKGALSIGKEPPISVDVSFAQKETGDVEQVSGSASLSYGKGKTFKVVADAEKNGETECKLNAEILTPLEGYKNNKLSITGKHSTAENKYQGTAQLTNEGKTWNFQHDVTLAKPIFVVDLQLTCPEGKTAKIYLKQKEVSPNSLDIELKIVNEAKDFLLEATTSTHIESIEDFEIKSTANSPNLKIDHFSLEIYNKPGQTNREIQVVGKQAGKNLLSGSLNYNVREENSKYIVEGSGTFKVKDENQSGNFKYSSLKLSQELNGETGLEISLDAALGQSAVDWEYKTTDKHYRFSYSVCEQKKECSHIEIDSKVEKNGLDSYGRVLEVNVDLRKLGLTHEFGLKSVTNRQGWKLDDTLDIHFQSKDNGKYQYSVYVHPNEAGVTLTTPKRILSLESKTQAPANAGPGKYSAEVVLYLDKKNHANKKTSVAGWIDVKSNAVNGEVKLTHPGLSKPLQASIKTVGKDDGITVETVLDVFAKPDQKIVALYKVYTKIDAQTKIESKETLEVKSSGLGVDILWSEVASLDKPTKSALFEEKLSYSVKGSKYNNVASLSVSPTQITGLVQLLNVNLLKLVSKLKLSKEEQIIDTELSSYDNNPLVSHLEVKDWNTIKYSLNRKNAAQNKLLLNAGLIPGQIADLRADILKENAKINLFHATLKLDDANFLKPDYSVNSKEIQEVLKNARARSVDFTKGLGAVGKEWVEDVKKEGQNIGELAKKSAPNLQPIKTFYSKEFKEIKDEISQDKTLKELAELVKKTASVVLDTTSEIGEKLSVLAEQIIKAIQGAFEGVLDTIEKQLLPQIKNVVEKLTSAAAEVLDTVAEILLGVVAKLSQVVEDFQPELKQAAATIGEFTQDIGRFIQKAYLSVRDIISEQWHRISEEIQALPLVEELKLQYKEFTNNYADGVINALKEIVSTIKDAIPNDFTIQKELDTILDSVTDYVEKKIKNQPVSDLEVLQNIVKNTVAAIKKLLAALSSEDLRLPGDWNVNSNSLDILDDLPRLVAAKFSPIEYLSQEDLSTQVASLLLSLVNHPRNWVPPFPLFGIIVQGQHIFTFDANHLTFPGNCDYVLARDAVNGNFTIVGTIKAGELTAITLADGKDSVTLLKGGQVKLNNAVTNLPARKPDLAAYRDYQMVTLRSTAGVLVTCTPDLSGCVVKVSGFYHGQVRGLLGNGNSEQFDDYTLPNGKIVTGETEFGNSYKVQQSCPSVTAPAHHDVQIHPDCNKLFAESDLKLCSEFVKPDVFKLACTHGLQSGNKDIEKDIAKAFVAVCNYRNIFIDTPERLLECTNGDKPYKVGDKFSVKLPGKAADIVLLVDTTKGNEQKYKELLQPVVQDIGKELHTKGINDVEFHLIAYGGENQWPSHVTVNGKLTFKGKAPNIKFSDEPEDDVEVPKEISKLEGTVKAIADLVKDLKLATGIFLREQTFSEGYHYPFRSHALKSLVVLNDQPCEVGRFKWLQNLRASLYSDEQITLNLFTPVPSLDVKDGKKTKDVIGFSEENVFLLSQGKKSPKGSSELRPDISYDDYCIDYTLQNRGNVFVNENFETGKADAKKTFIHVAAVNIVNELTSKDQGLDCECKRVNPWAAQNECTIAYTQDKKKKA